MISFSTLVFILLVHFLADFGLQTHDQATKKSTDIIWLTYHVAVYSLMWLFATFAYYGDLALALQFSLITFLLHWVTDFFTSRRGVQCDDCGKKEAELYEKYYPKSLES